MSNASEAPQLSQNYTYELFKASIVNIKVLDILHAHLKYQYLITEEQKKVYRFIVDTYQTIGQAPTIGTIGQAFSADKAVMAFLNKVKETNVDDKIDVIIDTLESFIKDLRFQNLYYKASDMYNEGKKNETFAYLAKESLAINDFTLKEKYYARVFGDFNERQLARQKKATDESQSILRQRCSFGIHELDALTNGGAKKGTSFCILARSGVGKSTFLRWIGLTNARLGKKVVLFQGEDTEEEALTVLDAAWTSVDVDTIELGGIPTKIKHQITKAHHDIMANGGELFVYAIENFERLTMEECNDILGDIIDIHGPIDMALWDYLEIFGSKGQYGTGESGERRRREDISNKMTAISTSRKIVVGTATQANDIAPELFNNPDFVLTRHHISEYKGAIKPFSYFITLNATDEEYDDEIMRIYCDKFRKHKHGKVITIYQSRSNGRFYDAKRTIDAGLCNVR